MVGTCGTCGMADLLYRPTLGPYHITQSTCALPLRQGISFIGCKAAKHSRRRVFLVGLVVLTVASVACGLSSLPVSAAGAGH